jgi:hypothetical protein
MVFKLDPVALVLDTFTFGIWSGYWNIQRITENKYLDNINARTFRPRPIREGYKKKKELFCIIQII